MSAIDYTPSPTVKEFLQSEAPENWLIGPVGGGKTVGALFKIIYHASRQRKGPDGVRRSKAVVVRSTMPQLKDTTISSWRQWFRDGIAGRWVASDNKFVLRFNDVECEVLFRPLDTPDDVSRVLSLEITYAVIDEFIQIPRAIIEALFGRLGRYPAAKDGGASWFGMWGASNTGNRTNWWYDYLFTETDAISADKALNAYGPLRRVFTQPSGFSAQAENLQFLPKPPDETPYYEFLARGKTRQWIKQFIECEWGFDVSGEAVFRTFDPMYHVSDRIRLDRNLPVLIGYDPGMNSAATFWQHDLNGRLIGLAEIGQTGMGTERFFKERVIPHIRREYPDNPVLVIPDPSARNRAQSNEMTALRVIKNLGFEYKLPSSNLIRPRLEAVEAYLGRLTPSGPGMVLHPRMLMTIEALQGGYRYSERKKHDEDPDPEKNQWSHYADTVQYVALYCRDGVDAQLAKRRREFTPPRFRNNYALGT